ncbi:MAG: hypothetical protein JNL58_08155 [Planctomyces sp.]|nr:hypothetical protein [Planctomyces sp.]
MSSAQKFKVEVLTGRGFEPFGPRIRARCLYRCGRHTEVSILASWYREAKAAASLPTVNCFYEILEPGNHDSLTPQLWLCVEDMLYLYGVAKQQEAINN